jgi:hypothetical protein
MSIPRAWPLALLLAGAPLLSATSCSSGPATGTGGTGGAPTGSVSSSAHASTGAVASGSGGSAPLTETFTVSGVVTDGKSPVEGALVMQGGGQPAMTTGPDGAYTITLTQAIPGTPAVVAAKIGYRAAGVEFYELPTGPVELALRFAAAPDNVGYLYAQPGDGDVQHDKNTTFCGHCHTTFAKQFHGSEHAESARSAELQDLYAGVSEAFPSAAACQAAGGTWRAGLVPGTASDTASKCYLGGGVLPDLNPACGGAGQLACDDPAAPAAEKPTAFGRCADCHAAGMDGKAGGRNLLDAVGVGYQEGTHCDLCHHVRDVDLSKPPGVGGALILQRPHETQSDQPGSPVWQVTYGPLADVPNGFVGGSYQPGYSASTYCGACHEQKQEALVPGTALDAARWPGGLPTHSTYSEWAASSYNTPAGQCQSCHMPKDDTGLTNSLDVTTPVDASITFGFVRAPDQIRQHTFQGALAGTPRLIDGALQLSLAAAPGGPGLAVDVQVLNKGSGHAIPSGEPMRALLLLIDADACGQALTPAAGMTLDDVAGATAAGQVGVDVTAAGSTLTWAAGAKLAKAGDAVRVVRPTGTFEDYAGIGIFAGPGLTPAQKGVEIRTPVGEAKVLSAAGAQLTLSAALAAQAGDLVYLGDAVAAPVTDGDASRALAGRAGHTFARVLVDATGARGVPHHRGVDLASDNRLASGASATTHHGYGVPVGCAAATVTAKLVYRRSGVTLARQRGWDARDYVVATATANVTLP